MRSLFKPVILTAAGVAGATLAVSVAGSVAAVAATALTIRLLRARPIPDGAVIVVTGGSRGLGLAIASRFAKHRRSNKRRSKEETPVRLVLAARNRVELEQAQSTLLVRHPHLRPEDFHLVAADLTDPAECRRLIAETIARFGRIDVLVNNAGIIEVGPIESQPIEAFERALKVNFLAALYTTWAALPHMRTQQPQDGCTRRAAIVNIASIGGKLAVPHMLPYSASKFALVGFSEGLHAELRHKGIRVTTVCPGLMRTGGEAHAHFTGQVEKEQRWFDLAANAPVLSASVTHAANRIYNAVVAGRAEITITPQAWLTARFAGLAPETTQQLNALANRYILPQAPQQQNQLL